MWDLKLLFSEISGIIMKYTYIRIPNIVNLRPHRIDTVPIIVLLRKSNYNLYKNIMLLI
jgi:hypothetical protein